MNKQSVCNKQKIVVWRRDLSSCAKNLAPFSCSPVSMQNLNFLRPRIAFLLLHVFLKRTTKRKKTQFLFLKVNLFWPISANFPKAFTERKKIKRRKSKFSKSNSLHQDWQPTRNGHSQSFSFCVFFWWFAQLDIVSLQH